MKPSSFYPCLIILLTLTLTSCATRGINDKYFGATEQRLMTHSIDKLVKELPENDFLPLKESKVFFNCYFIHETDALNYARERIRMELMDTYSCTITDTPEAADHIVQFFFNAMGTDQDSLGIKTPTIVIPGVGTTSVNLLTLEMYHGISELYYYVIDTAKLETRRGEKIKAVIRTDRLEFPFFTIPINSLK